LATVLLPRSLLALFPGVQRRHELAGVTVDEVLSALDGAAPGMRDRLVEEEGPRLRRHINVFVDGQPADLATPVGPASTVHVIPAVSGG
jgi:molybdopterin converting factor small subunit